MRVALVHDWLTGLRGGERALHELALLYPDADLFTLVHVPGMTTDAIEDRRIVSSPLSKLPGVARYYRLLLPLFPWAIRRFDLSQYDLVISCSHAVAKSVSTGPDTKHLCYCLTPMRYAWDQADAYLGRGFLRWVATPLIAYLRHFDTRYSDPKSVTEFVAISSTVRTRIRDHYGREASIVYPPVDVDAFDDERADPSPADRDAYLLVGGFVPYKLESLAIEAFARCDRTLIVVGDGPTRAELERTAPDNVRFLGRVGDTELRTRYRECRALLYPQEEDFGLVAVEAQAAGRPVIAYGRGGARDTVVDFRDARASNPTEAPATGVYFEEQTPEALLAALDLFEANEAAFEPKRIREWSLQFGIQRFRADFRRDIEKLLERPAL